LWWGGVRTFSAFFGVFLLLRLVSPSRAVCPRYRQSPPRASRPHLVETHPAVVCARVEGYLRSIGLSSLLLSFFFCASRYPPLFVNVLSSVWPHGSFHFVVPSLVCSFPCVLLGVSGVCAFTLFSVPDRQPSPVMCFFSFLSFAETRAKPWYAKFSSVFTLDGDFSSCFLHTVATGFSAVATESVACPASDAFFLREFLVTPREIDFSFSCCSRSTLFAGAFFSLCSNSPYPFWFTSPAPRVYSWCTCCIVCLGLLEQCERSTSLPVELW